MERDTEPVPTIYRDNRRGECAKREPSFRTLRRVETSIRLAPVRGSRARLNRWHADVSPKGGVRCVSSTGWNLCRGKEQSSSRTMGGLRFVLLVNASSLTKAERPNPVKISSAASAPIGKHVIDLLHESVEIHGLCVELVAADRQRLFART